MVLPSQNPTSISILVPTFNRVELLRECLVSILDEADHEDEIIVVDDGSTDTTAHLIETCFPRVKYVHQLNSGKGAALNSGLEIATRPYIWVVDDDDLVCPGSRQKLLSGFTEHKTAGFTYGKHNCFSDAPTAGRRTRKGPGYWTDCNPAEFLIRTLEDMFAHQGAMLVRRELCERIGGFSAQYARSNDYDFSIRLALVAQPAFVEGCLLDQRQHSGRRGTKDHPISAEDVENHWLSTDQEIISQFGRKMPIETYLSERRIQSSFDLRRAHLQKATIYARKRLWDEAFANFSAALDANTSRLTSAEMEIVSRATLSKYGMGDSIFQRNWKNTIQDLAKRSQPAVQLVNSLGYGMRWRIRQAIKAGNLNHAAQIGALSLRLQYLGN